MCDLCEKRAEKWDELSNLNAQRGFSRIVALPENEGWTPTYALTEKGLEVLASFLGEQHITLKEWNKTPKSVRYVFVDTLLNALLLLSEMPV